MMSSSLQAGSRIFLSSWSRACSLAARSPCTQSLCVPTAMILECWPLLHEGFLAFTVRASCWMTCLLVRRDRTPLLKAVSFSWKAIGGYSSRPYFRFMTTTVRLEWWTRQGRTSMNSGCPPVSIMCTSSNRRGFSEPFAALTSLTIAWLVGLSCGRMRGFGRRKGESGSAAEAGEEGGR